MDADGYTLAEKTIAAWDEGHGVAVRLEDIVSMDMLEQLLDGAASSGAKVRGGSMAKAVDMWVAETLRRIGFPEEGIWPRLRRPRALDPGILSFIAQMPRDLADRCRRELPRWYRSTDAFVMGAAYAKQVDVGMASWPSGPELLISTKTMGSSFGKNLSNRFEEAYGDAKNLKSRYPLAALGFVFLVHEDIFGERGSTLKMVSMLRKLQAERDVYDSVCLLTAAWDDAGARLSDDVRASGFLRARRPERLPFLFRAYPQSGGACTK